MNKNTNKWAVEVGTPNLSKAVQLLAFSFGYVWYAGRPEAANLTSKYLIFNPTNKTLTHSNWRLDVEAGVYQIVYSFEQVMGLLEKPPVADLQFGSTISVNRSGDVTVLGRVVGSDLFDRLVDERAKFLGKATKRTLPKVEFIYTSQNSGRKLRRILVTADSDGSLEGLDMDDDFRYKKYLHEKITGAVGFTYDSNHDDHQRNKDTSNDRESQAVILLFSLF